MSVCLLLIDDGREDYYVRCRESLTENLPPFDFEVEVFDIDHRLGFAGAIQRGWDRVLRTGADYIFHVESDFLFNEAIPLHEMIAVLDRHPQVAQVALKRQPWNEEERACGGFMGIHPENYIDRREGPVVWVEHRAFFTTNPSVYRRSLCERGWPQERYSEGMFSHYLFRAHEPPEYATCAFWGAKEDPPLVEHIGLARAGHSY